MSKSSVTQFAVLYMELSRQRIVLNKVQKQLSEWVPEKYGWKRTPHRAITRLKKFFTFMIFGKKMWRSNKPNMEFGTDAFGRSVFEGMQIYVQILLKRGIDLKTVLVTGSRVKAKWKSTSDVDVLIIADTFAKKTRRAYPWPLDKVVSLREHILSSDTPLCMGLEASFVSSTDFLTMIENFDIHALDVMYYGKPVYDNGYWQEALRLFNRLKNEYDLDKTDLKKMLFVL